MTATRVPVLIAGAGGLATSALLAKHGVRSLLVEKRREVFIYPKARNLSFRSLEILRGLGLCDEVHAVADHVSAMMVKPALNSGEEQLAIDVNAIFAGLDRLSPEPAAQYCPQSRLEPILLAETRRRGSEVRYGTELSSIEQDGAGVTAVVRDRETGESETVRADYLVGADGVHSPIRNWLGINTSGYSALPIFVYFRAPWTKFVAHLADGDAVQVKNADVDGIFLVVEGELGMFITMYFPARVSRRTSSPRNDAARYSPALSASQSTSTSSRSRPGNPTSRWPIDSVVGEHFSLAIRHTPCRRSRRGEPTPPSRVRTIWPGSWPPFGRDRRTGAAGYLSRRTPPGGAVRRPAVADRPDACRASPERGPPAIAGRGRVLDVRTAHRVSVRLGGRCERFR